MTESNWVDWLRPDVRVLAVAASSFGASLIHTIFSYYYVKVFIHIYKISSDWLLVAQTFFAVWNVFNEPIAGVLQEFGPNWMRNRKKVILVFGPLYVLSFLVPWFKWGSESPGWLVGVHLIVVLFFYDGLYTLAMSAYCGLFTEISLDQDVRIKLIQYSELAGLIGGLIVFPTDKLSGSLANVFNFQMCCVAIAALGIACFLFTGFKASDAIAHQHILTDNNVHDTAPMLCEAEENGLIGQEPNLQDAVDRSYRVGYDGDGPVAASTGLLLITRQILTNRDFICCVSANFCHYFRGFTFTNFLVIFTELLAANSVLKPGSYQIALFYAACSAVPKIFMILLGPVVHRFGSFSMIYAGAALTIINSSVALILAPIRSYYVIPFLLIEGILTRFQAYFMLLFSDVIDDDTVRFKRQKPVSLMIYALNGMIAKTTLGIVPLTIVTLLNSFGYSEFNENPGFENTATLKYKAFMLVCLIPVCASVLEVLLLLPYRLKSKHKRKLSE